MASLHTPAPSHSAPPAAQPGRLLEVIQRLALVAPETLARAQLVQDESGDRIDSILTRLGLVSEQALADALADASGLPRVAPGSFPAVPVAAGLLSARFLRGARAIPLAETPAGVTIAVADPFDDYAARAIGFALGRPVEQQVARASDIDAALDRLYGADVAGDSIDSSEADAADLERMKDLASDAPVIRAVNRLIAAAVEQTASDIHVEPTEELLKVRIRVDGVMRDLDPLPGVMKAAFVSRVKIMAGLNIAEKRLPQDGRMRLAVRGHDIDLRVATAPTIHGESVVLRLLDRSNLALDFTTLGFDPETEATMRRLIGEPHGIVLVTGPTGSGKTTTLYAALSSINAATRKILTVEDPVEYRLAGINQTQVSPQIGLTFAAALRSFLRQDPDVMMVGEIRDLETAQVAVQAALTGHMILSTLHTNTAAGAVTRLIDMGVEPFLITSTLTAVLAQRLVRRLCQVCRAPHPVDARALAAMGFEVSESGPVSLYKAVGCPACGHSGYRGRLAILELLVMDEAAAHLVIGRAEARDLQRHAVAHGMQTMLQDGFVKAKAGLTTVEDVLRVTRDG